MTDMKEEMTHYLAALYALNGEGLPEVQQAEFVVWKEGNDETNDLIREQRALNQRLNEIEHRKTQLSGQNGALAKLIFNAATPEGRAATIMVAENKSRPEPPAEDLLPDENSNTELSDPAED